MFLPTLAARPLRWAALFLCALVVALGGCAVQTQALRAQSPPGLVRAAELADTPFFAQTEYHCGPAALATVLGAAGLPADPAVLGEQVFLPARTGTLQIEMIAGARRQGAVATRVPPALEAVLREVQAGHPVAVLLNLGLSFAPAWHYAVLVGYDLDAGDAVLRSGATRRAVMPLRTFEHTWTRSGSWAFVALPPGQWPSTAQESAVVEASVGFERNASPVQAVAVYRSALTRWPANLTLRMGLGNTLHAAGDKAGAAEAFAAAAREHHSAPASINLASTLLELGRTDEAIAAARDAVAASDAAWRAQADAVLAQALAARPAAR
ncbi:PA2778 family cysteine peptidase [Piscinibacter sp. XHJ-5]|uniref:PA2778 family cysteine peptidase n=1 Tax=Piscinibacter sp. XHJ-5 TaxID=3037797 RepID=UPI002452D25A|nr:PA2778 family cysteine peptidase [Piscinibacter sp. XHJ-5]